MSVFADDYDILNSTVSSSLIEKKQKPAAGDDQKHKLDFTSISDMLDELE